MNDSDDVSPMPLGRSPLIDATTLSNSLSHRVRNHVNPLNIQYQKPTPPPNWEQVFPKLGQPIHLDIGTGSGRFLLAIAQANPDWNFLGVEIRRPLVDRANGWAEELGLKNVHFIFANINVSLRHWLAPGDLARVTVQFPDPWFKLRHRKRRVVQAALVDQLAQYLAPGAPVFLQSDIEEMAQEMAARFLAHPAFEASAPLNHNPLGVPTQREEACLKLGKPIYRYWLTRQALENP